MKHLHTLILSICCLIATLSGCKEPAKIEVIHDTKLEVSPEELTFISDVSTQTITVTSNGKWYLDASEMWCQTSTTSGEGNGEVDVTLSANPSSTERSATITFTAKGAKDQVVHITQNAAGSEGVIIYPDAASGITLSPRIPDADGPCTIYFKPTSSSSISSALYDSSSDLYAHIGVYHDDEWKYVPAEWGENIAKCKFEKVDANSYKLELKPSIRSFFGSGTTPVTRLAIVIRNADGTAQTSKDQFATVTDTKYKDEIFTPGQYQEAPLPAEAAPGINYNSDGSVTLVLYEKGKDGLFYDYSYAIGDFNDWKMDDSSLMKRDKGAGCWWITLTGIDPDKEYRFQYCVGNATTKIRIHDPYTEIVYDPWNDKYIPSSTYPNIPEYPSGAKELIGAFKVNRDSYDWEVPSYKIKDQNSVVIYEIHLRDFTESKDLNGALQKLDYLKELGVNALELMPIQEFEGNDSWGYNPCSYFALDKAYGTRQMYKKFIDECHKRDMGVIIDVVYNQATGAHPMAKLYWNGDNVSARNPWFNVTCPHGFGVFQDWNHTEQMTVMHVEQSLINLLNQYHVDGFRFDLTKGFTNHSGKDDSYDQQRVDILKGYNRCIKGVKPDAMVICEHFVDAENEALGADGMHVWGNNNYNYSGIVAGKTPDISYAYDPKFIRVGYMESHDEERICVAETSGEGNVSWGIVGTMNSWGSSDDISMAADDVFFVAKNVSLTATDEFKIRKYNDSTWNDQYNYGSSAEGTKLSADVEFTLTLGSGSKNLKAAAAGKYDIYFYPVDKKLWLMSPGKRPASPSAGGNQGGAADKAAELELRMRRAGLATAFFLTIPGPKMIWEFGEMGYDYSIESNGGRTAAKPPRWDYLDQPERKQLHDVYAGLLKLRNDYPALFTKGAEFKWASSGTNKYISVSAQGRYVYVMGNFGTTEKECTATLPFSANWYNYFDRSESQNTDSYKVTLKPGEFRVLVNFK